MFLFDAAWITFHNTPEEAAVRAEWLINNPCPNKGITKDLMRNPQPITKKLLEQLLTIDTCSDI
mgnify:CR=1 FL=1